MRYHRQIILPEIGPEGQRRISRGSVLIVGLGGLGAPVATYLTGAGVGRIGLADSDIVSESNLQRQVLYAEADLGVPKAEAAAARLQAQSSHTRFDLWPDGLTADNGRDIIQCYDLVVDCTDNFAARYLIDDLCAELNRPWVHGSIGAFTGQVSVFNHQTGRRYAELFPDRDALCALPRPVETGVLGPVAGTVGAIQASEALKIIARFGEVAEGKLFCINLLTLKTEIIYV